MPLDSVRVDFATGAIEQLVLRRAADHDVLFIEGQGSLLHPASTATLALIHGVNERVPVEDYLTGVKFYRQLIENTAPAVAVARHETLEQSQGRPLPGRRSVLDRSGQRRHVRKPGTGGEELADLVVEVEPGLYLSQGLHDE